MLNKFLDLRLRIILCDIIKVTIKLYEENAPNFKSPL